MKMSPEAFEQWSTKRITLLGMSGVGKTTLANHLPKDKWFHFSGDYRIGTRYLKEPILDNIKQRAMGVPFLRDLLLSDSIYICSNISVNNLAPVATFLGKIGRQEEGGLPLAEFKRRQALHRQAEIAAMMDVPEFIDKATSIYGYQHFINDAGGSVCELEAPEVLETLAQHTVIIYLRASAEMETMLIERALADPKPLYYRDAFLDQKLAEFSAINGGVDPDQMSPDQFVNWVFVELFRSRLPRYQAIADRYGYVIEAADLDSVSNEADLIQLVVEAIRQQQ